MDLDQAVPYQPTHREEQVSHGQPVPRGVAEKAVSAAAVIHKHHDRERDTTKGIERHQPPFLLRWWRYIFLCGLILWHTICLPFTLQSRIAVEEPRFQGTGAATPTTRDEAEQEGQQVARKPSCTQYSKDNQDWEISSKYRSTAQGRQHNP